MAPIVAAPDCHGIATRLRRRRRRKRCFCGPVAPARRPRTGLVMSTQRDDAGRIAAADLTDELWRWQHLAKYTGHSRGYAVTLADRPGFPARTTRPRPRHRPCAPVGTPVGTPVPRRRSPATRSRCGSRRRGWRRERRPTARPGRAGRRVPAVLRGGPGRGQPVRAHRLGSYRLPAAGRARRFACRHLSRAVERFCSIGWC